MTNIFIKNNKLYRNGEVLPLGITDWKPQISYSLNEFVKVSNKIYYSVSNNNQGNNPTFSGSWKLFNNKTKNHVLKSYDEFKISLMPINYTSSGTDANLISPVQDGEPLLSNQVLFLNSLGGVIFAINDAYDTYWQLSFGAIVGNYYTISMVNFTVGAGILLFDNSSTDWDNIADSSYNGLKTWYMPAGRGYFEYYFDSDAYKTALQTVDPFHSIRISQNGSVYKNSITQANLIVRWDGVVGEAGGGLSISDTVRVDYNTINHNEYTKELFVFTRNSIDEIKIPETFIVSESQLTITDDNAEGLIRRNILPITENILYDYSTITGTNIINHNLNLEDYFVASKNNITSTLSVRTVTKQTENSCVISAITGTASENYYFINKNNFDKCRYFDASTEGEWTSSTLKINHDIGSSDYFVWAVDNDNNKKVAIPNAHALGPRFASLDFNASYSSNLTVYFGGTSDNSTWFTGSGIQSTNYVTTDNNDNEWKVYIDASGILNTQLID
jgi:hypothetical protein